MRNRSRPDGSRTRKSASRVMAPDATRASCFSSSPSSARLVDLRAEDGGIAHHEPVGRVQPVDLAGDQCLDRLGELGGGPLPGGLQDQRLEEQRVAATTQRQGRQRRRDEGLVAESHLDELQRRGRIEGRGPQRRTAGAGFRHEAARIVPAGHQDEPGSVLDDAGQLTRQVGGRVVHQLGVLEHQDRGGRQHRAEQIGDDGLEPCLAELPVELFRLLGRGRETSSGTPRSGSQGARYGVELATRSTSRRDVSASSAPAGTPRTSRSSRRNGK